MYYHSDSNQEFLCNEIDGFTKQHVPSLVFLIYLSLGEWKALDVNRGYTSQCLNSIDWLCNDHHKLEKIMLVYWHNLHWSVQYHDYLYKPSRVKRLTMYYAYKMYFMFLTSMLLLCISSPILVRLNLWKW